MQTVHALLSDGPLGVDILIDDIANMTNKDDVLLLLVFENPVDVLREYRVLQLVVFATIGLGVGDDDDRKRTGVWGGEGSLLSMRLGRGKSQRGRQDKRKEGE